MDRQTKTLAIGGVGIAAAVALGLTGATIAGAADTGSTATTSTVSPSASPSAGSSGSGSDANGGGSTDGTLPGGGMSGGGRGGPMDAGGTLTAEAASKAVTAARGAVSGGTVSGVRALSDGSYEVTVTTDGGRVDVLVSKTFEVTGTEQHTGGPGGGGMPDGAGPGDQGSGTGSTSPSDANGTSATTTSGTATV